jgi:hypothetical protein
MENGKWKMENGKWKMENGKWKTKQTILNATTINVTLRPLWALCELTK